MLLKISMDLSQPTVFYSLIVLSVTNPIWSTPEFRNRYSGFYLLGKEWLGENDRLCSIFKPNIKNVLPFILVSKNDPDKEVCRMMGHIWSCVFVDGDAFHLSEYLKSTVDSLIELTSSLSWKVRYGACKALSDIIIGRTWADFGGGTGLNEENILNNPQDNAATRILQLIRATVRSLDDIRLPVREAGASLATTLKGLLVRLCDSSRKCAPIGVRETAEITAATITCLPYLIKVALITVVLKQPFSQCLA